MNLIVSILTMKPQSMRDHLYVKLQVCTGYTYITGHIQTISKTRNKICHLCAMQFHMHSIVFCVIEAKRMYIPYIYHTNLFFIYCISHTNFWKANHIHSRHNICRKVCYSKMCIWVKVIWWYSTANKDYDNTRLALSFQSFHNIITVSTNLAAVFIFLQKMFY